jgi:hypothetical protein
MIDLEIEVPSYSDCPFTISPKLTGIVVEQVLKAVMPEKDFSVVVSTRESADGERKVIVGWMGVD